MFVRPCSSIPSSITTANRMATKQPRPDDAVPRPGCLVLAPRVCSVALDLVAASGAGRRAVVGLAPPLLC
jgi:hypothetical protein